MTESLSKKVYFVVRLHGNMVSITRKRCFPTGSPSPRARCAGKPASSTSSSARSVAIALNSLCFGSRSAPSLPSSPWWHLSSCWLWCYTDRLRTLKQTNFCNLL